MSVFSFPFFSPQSHERLCRLLRARQVGLVFSWLCQVKTESDTNTMDRWNYFIEGIAFRLNLTKPPFIIGCCEPGLCIGSRHEAPMHNPG